MNDKQYIREVWQYDLSRDVMLSGQRHPLQQKLIDRVVKEKGLKALCMAIDQVEERRDRFREELLEEARGAGGNPTTRKFMEKLAETIDEAAFNGWKPLTGRQAVGLRMLHIEPELRPNGLFLVPIAFKDSQDGHVNWIYLENLLKTSLETAQATC